MGSVAGIGGTAGAQRSADGTSYGLDCDSGTAVSIINDSTLTPGRREGAAPTSRQSLGKFLRQSGVTVPAGEFVRAGGGEGAGLHVHRRDGRSVATAYVAPLGDSFHVPKITACAALAEGDTGEEGR